VQPGDDEAERLDGAPNACNLVRLELMRLVAERERSDLEAVVAERCGQFALPLERQMREHLVAKRDPHVASPPRGVRPIAERTNAPAPPVMRRTPALNAGM